MIKHKIFCAFGARAVDVSNPRAIVVVPLADAAHIQRNLQRGDRVTLNFTKRLEVAPWDEVELDTIGCHSKEWQR